jgi:hydroxyacylglutathione hydrolase
LGGQLASWAGTLIPIGTSIAIIADTQDQVSEAVVRLARVGHDSVTGYLLMSSYDGERKTLEQISVIEGRERTSTDPDLQFIDVRRRGEYEGGHAMGAVNMPLDKLDGQLNDLDPSKPTYVICQGGYRSSIATSMLENAGSRELYNLAGGTAAWMKQELPIEH